MFVPGPYSQVVLRWEQEGFNPAYNIFGVYYPGPVTHGQWVTMADALRVAITDAITQGLNAALTTNIVLESIRITDCNEPDSWSKHYPLAIAGTQANTPLPPGTAAVISFSGAKATRAHRGRMYIPGITSWYLNPEGIMTPAARTVLLTFAERLHDRTSAVGAPLAIVSKRLNGQIRQVADVNAVTSWAVDGRFDRQVRRGRV